MRKQILVSDIDGTEIPDGTGALVTVKPFDGRKGAKELHMTDEQADDLGKNGRTVARRGRRPAAQESQRSGRGRRTAEPAPAS